MDTLRDFIKNNVNVAFATAFDNQPELRVLQVMLIRDNEFYFATNAGKDIYKQIQSNPKVAFMASKGMVFARIDGICLFDIDDETKREVYEKNPILQTIYKNYLDIAYFKVQAKKATYYDLGTQPITDKKYTFE